MQLSTAQQLAVTHKDGPMMVLAGPGSGKTFTITNRIRYLTEEEGIHPGTILVITFTKAAAEEMKERYEALVSEQNGMVNFGTFHAVFFKILRYAYQFDSSNILRDLLCFSVLSIRPATMGEEWSFKKICSKTSKVNKISLVRVCSSFLEFLLVIVE